MQIDRIDHLVLTVSDIQTTVNLRCQTTLNRSGKGYHH